jgi:hypothetical protein
MVGLGIVLFVFIWVGIIYELKNAPEMDDDGNMIEKNE